jgi:hypothetical protein
LLTFSCSAVAAILHLIKPRKKNNMYIDSNPDNGDFSRKEFLDLITAELYKMLIYEEGAMFKATQGGVVNFESSKTQDCRD